MLRRFGAKRYLLASFSFFTGCCTSFSCRNKRRCQQLDKLGIEDVKQFWDGLVTKYGGYLPESQKGSFMEFVKGEKEFSLKEWMIGLLKYLFHELAANGKLLSTLIMLTIFSALLQSLQSAFQK